MQWSQDQKGISGGSKVSISSSGVYLYSKAWDDEVGPSPDCESKHSKLACWEGGTNMGGTFLDDNRVQFANSSFFLLVCIISLVLG